LARRELIDATIIEARRLPKASLEWQPTTACGRFFLFPIIFSRLAQITLQERTF